MPICRYCDQHIEWATIDGQSIPIHPGGYCPGREGNVSNTREVIAKLRPKPYLSINHFTNPHAKCPVCRAPVFYYQNEHGSKVYFDVLGPPWDKHPCTSKQTPTAARVKHPANRSNNVAVQNSRPDNVPEWQIFLVSEVFLEDHCKKYPYYTLRGLVSDQPFSLTITPSTAVRLKVKNPFYIKYVDETECLLTTLIDEGKELFSYEVKGFSEVRQARASHSLPGEFEWRKKIKIQNEPVERAPNSSLSLCDNCGKEVTLYETPPGSEIAMDLLSPPWLKHHCDRTIPISVSKKWQRIFILTFSQLSADRLVIRAEGAHSRRYMINIQQPGFIINKNHPLFLRLVQNGKSASLSTVTTGEGGKLLTHFWDCIVSRDKNNVSSRSVIRYSSNSI